MNLKVKKMFDEEFDDTEPMFEQDNENDDE